MLGGGAAAATRAGRHAVAAGQNVVYYRSQSDPHLSPLLYKFDLFRGGRYGEERLEDAVQGEAESRPSR